MNIAWPERTRIACMVAGLLAAPMGGAAGPVGSLGPVGPVGPHAGDAAGFSGKVEKAPPPEPMAQKTEGNRIEVTGNRVSGTACGTEGVSVNSVDVRREQLEGRTVIVQGQNVNGADTRDCPGGQAQSGGNQVNSIRIR